MITPNQVSKKLRALQDSRNRRRTDARAGGVIVLRTAVLVVSLLCAPCVLAAEELPKGTVLHATFDGMLVAEMPDGALEPAERPEVEALVDGVRNQAVEIGDKASAFS